MRRQRRVQEKSGVGWKRTSKYDVVSRDEVEVPPKTDPTVGVGKMDMRIRAMESAGMS